MKIKQEFREVTLEDCRDVVNIDWIPHRLCMERGISIEKAKKTVYSLDEKELESMIDETAQLLFQELLKGVKVVKESGKFLCLELDPLIKAVGGWDKFKTWIEEYGIGGLVITGRSGYLSIPKRNLFTS